MRFAIVAPDVTCILFDLGGVLVDFRGVEALAELLGSACDVEGLRLRWLEIEALRRFERGVTTIDQFERELRRELPELEGLRGESFLDWLHGWVPGPLPGALELLDELSAEQGKERPLLGCFSNTNPLHWQRMGEGWRMAERFDRAFLSFEIGLVKPDLEAFRHVQRQLDLEPEEILFLDDHPRNVEGALEAGLDAHLTRGPGECRRLLADRGLLPP